MGLVLGGLVSDAVMVSCVEVPESGITVTTCDGVQMLCDWTQVGPRHDKTPCGSDLQW